MKSRQALTLESFRKAFPFDDHACRESAPLAQLGLPTSRELLVWCAPDEEGAHYQVRGVQRMRGPVSEPLPEGENGYQLERVEEGAFVAVRVSGLAPATTYRLLLSGPGGDDLDLTAQTAPAQQTEEAEGLPAAVAPFSFLAFSCFAPFSRQSGGALHPDAVRTLQMLEACGERPHGQRPAFALGMGDQVYVDEGAYSWLKVPMHSLLSGNKSQQLRYEAEQPEPYFDLLYRAHFSLRPLDRALQKIPTALMWDDHEIRDGWGSHGDERTQHWHKHLSCARSHFLRYQLLRSAAHFEPERWPFGQGTQAPSEGKLPSTHYQFDWGAQATFFVMDQRSQRWLSEDKQAGGVLGEAQWEALERWLTPDDAGGGRPRLFVLVSPVPLTTPRWAPYDPAGFLPFRRDDRRDRWWSPANHQEGRRLLSKLAQRFAAGRDRLLIMSGDVHYSEVRELRLPSGAVLGHEVISSGLAQSSYQRWYGKVYDWNEARPAFSDVLHSRSLGRHLGAGFAELSVTPSAEGVPELRVLFHLADSTRDRELSGLLAANHDQAATKHELSRFALHPTEQGTLLELKSRAKGAQDPVGRSLRAQGSDSIAAMLAVEEKVIQKRRALRADWQTPRDERGQGAADGAPPQMLESAVRHAEAIPLGHADDGARARSGLALSGGGIRSATVSLGFMRELQEQGRLSAFDYVSSVSGGSYASGYLQAMTSAALRRNMGRQIAPEDMYQQAFQPAAIEALHNNGRYLAQGSGGRGMFNLCRLLTGYLASLVQHWLWLASVLVTLSYLAGLVGAYLQPLLVTLLGLAGLSVLGRVVLSHDTRQRLWLEYKLEDGVNIVESLLLLMLTSVALLWAMQGLPGRLASWLGFLEAGMPANSLSIGQSFTVLVLVTLSGMGVSAAVSRHVSFMTRVGRGTKLGGLMGIVVLTVSWLSPWKLSQLPGLSTLLNMLEEGAQHALELLPSQYADLLISLAGTLFLTLITSPNGTSSHRYYAARLADAFLTTRVASLWQRLTRRDGGVFHRAAQLSLLADDACYGPYPLFNACVNMLGDDPAFAGQQTGDYFVFSPHFCGSKLTGYARTQQPGMYSSVSLAEAITCSGAAISPFQGRTMPSLTSTLMWLLNLRTDLWLPNPRRPRGTLLRKMLGDRAMAWGPLTQLRALAGKLDTRARFVNVSDGAFVDGSGVYELLRRRCRVIVAVDATWDPDYDFHTLRNLVRRAMQELHVSIEFVEDPEKVIKPAARDGLSLRCVTYAKVTWPDEGQGSETGVLYYLKSAVLRDDALSSVAGARGADPARAYATYHPGFPQESTADQFFDPVQWQAYHELGRGLGKRLLEAMRAHESYGFGSPPPAGHTRQRASAVGSGQQ